MDELEAEERAAVEEKRIADEAEAKRVADQAEATRIADEAEARRIADDASAALRAAQQEEEVWLSGKQDKRRGGMTR